MKVVVLGPTYPFRGGIAHYTALLAEHLGESHEVTLLSFKRGYPRLAFPGRTDRDPSRAPLRVPAEYTLGPLEPHTWWRTARRIKALAPDLLLVQWWVPFWAPSVGTVSALVRRGGHTRVVFVCHNVLGHDGGGLLERTLGRAALSTADGFLVHSAADQALLATLRPGALVVRGVLPTHDITAPVARDEARRALGLAGDAQVPLFFGFVRPYKGVPVLLEAVARLVRRLPALHLVVAGESWLPDLDAARIAAGLGIADRVTVLDHYIPNEDVGRLLAASDVVVLPYLEASQSGVVPLAATAGRPIVASAVGGLPDVVHDEVTGLLVPPGDAGALADALERLFTEPGLLARLTAGVAEHRDEFAWSRLVALVEELARMLGVGQVP